MAHKKQAVLLTLAFIASAASLQGMHKPQHERTFFDGIRGNSVELVRRLALTHPTLVTAYDCYGTTPLHLAVTYKRTDIVRFLCNYFANAVHLKNRRTETPLHKAAQIDNREIITLLIQAGAHVDATTDHGNTPLHKAACSGAVEGIDLLYSALSIPNQIEYNPIHLAVQHGHQATLQKLLEHASQDEIEKVTSDNETPLMMAVIYGHLACAQLLLERGASTEASDGKPSLLKQSLTHRHIHIARYLLIHGITIMPDTISILGNRRLSPNQTYIHFLEEVHEKRVKALQSWNRVPDDISNLIATFCLSQDCS